MEWIANRPAAASLLKKYGAALLILLLGLILMMLPEKEEVLPEKKVDNPSVESSMEQSLQDILTLIEGAGKVAVLLTEKTGEEILYQTDDASTVSDHAEDLQSKTVLVTDGNRNDTGLIRQVNPPVLQGAVIVCQGAENPKVKLAVVEAVMRATGLPSNCICVLKMK